MNAQLQKKYVKLELIGLVTILNRLKIGKEINIQMYDIYSYMDEVREIVKIIMNINGYDGKFNNINFATLNVNSVKDFDDVCKSYIENANHESIQQLLMLFKNCNSFLLYFM